MSHRRKAGVREFHAIFSKFLFFFLGLGFGLGLGLGLLLGLGAYDDNNDYYMADISTQALIG